MLIIWSLLLKREFMAFINEKFKCYVWDLRYVKSHVFLWGGYQFIIILIFHFKSILFVVIWFLINQTLLTTSLLVATHRSTWQLWLKSLKDRVQNSKSMVLDWLSSIESCTHLCIILPTTASFHRQWQAIETLLIFSFSAVRKYHPWHSLKLELLVG